MSLFGVEHIIDNNNYLNALNDSENNVSIEILHNMPSYDDPKIRQLEHRMRQQGNLQFDSIFHESTGYYLFQKFLESRGGVDKALFLKDVEAFTQMRFEKARLKVAKLIFYRYLAGKNSDAQPSVFDGIKKRAMLKRRENPPGSGRNLLLGRQARSPSQKLETPHSENKGEEDKSHRKRAHSARDRAISKQNSTPSYTVYDSKSPEDEDEDVEVGKTNALEIYDDSANRVSKTLQEEKAPTNLFDNLYQWTKGHLVERHFPTFLQSPEFHIYVRTKVLEEAHVGVEDFSVIRLLGRGGFGAVFACKKRDSGKLYAMKRINKKLIKFKKAISMTMLERQTLSLVQSRFVCNLAYAFQDKTYLYLIMDLMPGGDLKFHLTRTHSGVAQGFSEARVRFHAAEILLGLEAMHQKNIIFRDLKLENVLLDYEGHCKISDLGLVALYGKKPVSHYAGTPGYIAPEVAKKLPYGFEIDLFSFGVTIYRMLSGRKPFRGQSRQDFDNSVCNDEPEYDPEILSPDAISLLKGLMEKDPKKRLGAGENGMQAIKDHPFFAQIDWGLLEVGYLDPPFVPSKHDVNASAVNDIGDDPDSKLYDKVILDDKFKKQIQGFEYVSKQAVRHEIVAALQKQAEEEAHKQQNGADDKAKAACCTIL